MKPVALSVLLLLTACQVTPVIDLDEEIQAILEADRAFAALSEATTAKNAFANYLAPDASMFPASSEGAIDGYERSIALFGADGDPGYQLLWQPQYGEVAKAGDLGWTWGKWQRVVDGKIADSGKYVNVWKKQADGSWKVRVDVGNQRPETEADD